MPSTPNLNLQTTPAGATDISAAYNPSMQTIDVLLQLVVQDVAITTPPSTVAGDAGKRWLVGTGATGDWATHDQEIAVCTGANLWTFYDPLEGYSAYALSDNKTYQFDGAVWAEAVVGGSLAASAITYNNTTSGLTAVNAQAAIDELVQMVEDIPTPTPDTDNVLTALDIVSGNVALNLSVGGFFTLLLDENVTGFTITNPPDAGKAGSWAIRLRQDATGGRTLALPTSFKATGGSDTAPATAANAYTLLTFTTFDQGTRYEYAMQEIAA